MFYLTNSVEVTINNVPIQWIPKIELYYPDLPQFPIMYIHCLDKSLGRIIGCPVSVSYSISGRLCTASFLVLTNAPNTTETYAILKKQLEERIGFSNKITFSDIKKCCKGNHPNIALFEDLWQYIEKSYGSSIPYGQYFEEMFSIARFVSAWQPKTGRQSEMRMLYNFMSFFGEEAVLPPDWDHLEYYITPTYEDVRSKNYTDFPKFKKLYSCMQKLFTLEFTKTVTIGTENFQVMPRAWKQNKDDFINSVSKYHFDLGNISADDKEYAEKLVDAFNRHAWRAAYYISAFMNIETTDYRTWNKSFFSTFYDEGAKLKGYSEKVVACFLQQGFSKEEIIPIDTWIETFYRFPLGISTRSSFYAMFDGLGKLERVIWLASQSNKTNMKNFYDILWCQRYGTIGNTELRGINPLCCSLCRLNKTCVGLRTITGNNIYVSNTITESDISTLPASIQSKVSFICVLENDVPKKIYAKNSKGDWYLNDEFSGYTMTKALPSKLISTKIINVALFINALS